MRTERPGTIHYLGLWGADRTVEADFDLGWGTMRDIPESGFRRAARDICHGYVSGFRKRDIAYYVLTRSFSRKMRSAVAEPATDAPA